jgi:hypothetical protein
MDLFFPVLSKVLVFLFLIGGAGCLLVIPLTARQLISAALEEDTEEETMGLVKPEKL